MSKCVTDNLVCNIFFNPATRCMKLHAACFVMPVQQLRSNTKAGTIVSTHMPLFIVITCALQCAFDLLLCMRYIDAHDLFLSYNHTPCCFEMLLPFTPSMPNPHLMAQVSLHHDGLVAQLLCRHSQPQPHPGSTAVPAASCSCHCCLLHSRHRRGCPHLQGHARCASQEAGSVYSLPGACLVSHRRQSD